MLRRRTGQGTGRFAERLGTGTVRFKLDENLPVELAWLFRDFGHDAVTVLDQGLGGINASRLASICVDERRVIVTLDKDFADIRAYPPDRYPGFVVFRLRRQGRDHVLGVGLRLLRVLRDTALDCQLPRLRTAQLSSHRPAHGPDETAIFRNGPLPYRASGHTWIISTSMSPSACPSR